MFAGQQTLSKSMLGGLIENVAPTAEEMTKERERVTARKHVDTKGHHVKIFDMHASKQRADYEKLMKVLIAGSQARTHVIWDNERQLVAAGPKQHWMRYLEWTEFELQTEPTAPVGT